MKLTKTMKTLAVILALTVGEFAISDSGLLEKANNALQEVSKSINSSATKLQMYITAYEANDKNVTKWASILNYAKKGHLSDMDLKALGSYDYTNNEPNFLIDASLKVDLVKIFGQQGVNEFGSSLDELVNNLASDVLEEYKDSAKVTTELLDKVVDENGNIKAIKLFVKIVIDLAKLPDGRAIDGEAYRSVEVSVELTEQLIAAKAQCILNPKYYGFNEEQEGMKEIVEALASGNTEYIQGMIEEVQLIDSLIQTLLDEGI